MISKKVVNKKIVIVVETKNWPKKKIQELEAQREFPTGYWEWLELLNHSLVPDNMFFQLDAWDRI